VKFGIDVTVSPYQATSIFPAERLTLKMEAAHSSETIAATNNTRLQINIKNQSSK
jgi:hypothetical protein